MVVLGHSGILAPGRWRWARALVWMVALGALLIVAYNAIARGVLMAMLSTSDAAAISAAPAGGKLVSTIAGVAALVALYWGAIRLAERRRVPELAVQGLPKDLLFGGAVGAGLMVVIVGILWLGGWVVVSGQPISAIAMAARDSLRSGVVEELVLRLVIFRLVWRALGIWPALAFAAMLFGLLHLANPDSGWFAVVALIAGEGIAIGLYLTSGRIWAPIGFHAAWNFAQGWLFGAAVSGTTDIAGGPLVTRAAARVPDVLSGGGFGPEASLAALIVSLLASVGFLGWAWKRGDFTAAEAAQTSGKAPTSS